MSSTRVRRGAFPRWCRTCGWKRSYDTAGKADSAKRQHSCGRWLDKAASAERGQARKSSVDRTPQPCLHKVADHQHGTRACYVLDRCRCLPCAKANATAEIARIRQKAYGRYDKYADAGPIREHLDRLSGYGIGLKQVSRISGVSNGALTKIYYGTYRTTGMGKSAGRFGIGELVRGPAKRVLRTTAERILAVEAVPANLGPHQPDHDRTALARQHLRALVALGWSMTLVGDRLGMTATNIGRVIKSDDPMYRATVDKVESVYAELCMTPPRADDQRSRISVSRSKRYAAQRGWLPPLALDDLEVDHTDAELDPDHEPDVDEVAVLRRMNGDRSVDLKRIERVDLVRRARGAGWSYRDLAERAGIEKPERYIMREVEAVAS